MAKKTMTRGRRVVRLGVRVVLVLVLLGVAAGGWVALTLRSSLPRVDGELRVDGLSAPVTIERDALGIPTIRGAGRADVAWATGYVHAQERYFQMDLLRRSTAGELSGLFGARAFAVDAPARLHRLRARAARAVEESAPEVRAVVEAYTAGVNAGLDDLGARPFEYLLLRQRPEPWKEEDTYLVLLAMFVRLQEQTGAYEATITLMHDRLPPPLVSFLLPPGTRWDAPLVGRRLPGAAVPDAGVIDLRERPAKAAGIENRSEGRSPEGFERHQAASNGWAVSGEHTADGRALLANELHLNLGVPNIWFRAVLEWPGGADGATRRVVGVTLPGTPATVIGSNGRVAWGLTNSLIDTSDLVVLDVDPADPDVYRTPDGERTVERRREEIHAAGGEVKEVEVPETVWGPIVDQDADGHPRAIRWVVQEPGAVDFDFLRLETVDGVLEAVDVARRSGIPALNFVAVDDTGRTAWTIAGRVPKRRGHDGRVAVSWADGAHGWDGLAEPEEVPAVIDPAGGRIWSANQRMVDGADLALLGDGGYVLGARATQIRDTLLGLEDAGERAMLDLQLDDRALFLARWRELVLDQLTPEAVAEDPTRGVVRQVMEDWGGHASVDSAGYRFVQVYRIALALELFPRLTELCREADPRFDYLARVHAMEAPLWAMVTERPENLLPAGFESWQELLLAKVDGTAANLLKHGRPLPEATWGLRNVASITHPLSGALPGLGRWLDMPRTPLPGDDHMPRVQHPSYGASLRMVVSPGHEQDGFFEMPGGESGNPVSPHYDDQHRAWEVGEPTPLLPGPAVESLTLRPATEDGARGGTS